MPMYQDERGIAERVRKAVAASGLSGYRLAQMSGLPESTVSRLRRGLFSPSLETAERLAQALGYRVVLRKRNRTGKGE